MEELNELKIEYLSPDELTPYENNTRKHNPEDIEGIKKSILECGGFIDPIGIWGEQNLIVEGHGRQIAAKELHLEKVPVIRLDHLTETQQKEYRIRHNRSAEMSEWDFAKLEEEIAALELEGVNLDDLNFNFDFETDEKDGDGNNIYTPVVNIPQYVPSGNKPQISELIDTGKVESLLEDIEDADIPDDVKDFLKMAAYRHAVIDFDKVADYYAESPKKIQELMEQSALVIIDVEDAIANGYAALQSALDDAMEDEDDE